MAGRDWLGDSFRTEYEQASVATGRFNLAVFGKTGVGKSTLVNAIFGEEVARTGIGEPVTKGSHLYVDRVGTRQEARGRGLARAVLLGTVAAAAADGAWTTMELTVDAANPTRADALYRSVGFVPVRTQAAFARTVPPGA